jgi:Carboxypeptidase regulatory-like domain
MQNTIIVAIRRAFLPLILLALLSAAAGPAYGQSTYGNFVGTVSDPSGAVVPNATITVTENSIGVSRTATTDGRGDFSLVNLDAGVYSATVTATGFAPRDFKDVHLLARESVRLDTTLQPGGGTQAVIVNATSADIEVDLTKGDTKSGQQINELALNFRASSATSPLVVAPLTPEVQVDQSGHYSVAGDLPNATSFSLDGISTQNVRNGGPNADLFPSVESFGEFKVNTGSNDAEFAQASDITVTSKGGTNDFHGALFYFTQNAAFNAADPYAHEVLPVIANDFGVTLGGPISIPHLYNGKDKSFFFFTYEGTRRPESDPINEILPSTSQRSGILAAPALNPCTGAITTNFSNCLNPASIKALNAFFPLPNLTNGPDDATNQFVIKGNYHLDGYDGRVDQVVTPNMKVFVRYSHKDVSDTGDDGDSNYNPLMGPFSNGEKLRNLAGSYNWVLRPNIVNEFRAGLSYVNTSQTFPQAAQGAAIDKEIGITGLPPVPSSGGISNFQVGNYVDPNGAVAGSAGTNSFGRPRHVQQHIYEVGDNVTWIKGAHSLKFGFSYTHLSYIDQITFTNGDEFGDYYYSGAFTGDPLGDFLTGLVSQADYAQNGPDGQPFASQYGFFGQDEWKLTKRLTVSYGLRYQINPAFNDATHQLGQFDRNYAGGRLITQGQVGLGLVAPSWRAQVGNTPFVTNSQVGLPITLRNTYWDNVQPRFGFAYDPYGSGKTIVKAHVGAYSVPILGAVLYSLLGVNTSNFPQFESSATNVIQFPNVFGGAGAFLTNCNTPGTPPAGEVVITSCPGYRRANNENLKDPRVIQWNASVEQAVGRNTVFHLLYNGSHTTQLIYSPDLNQVEPNTVGYAALTATPALRQKNLKYPNFSEVLTRDNGPSAKYEAGTAQLQRRFGAGLTFDASYTWAHNLSNALGSAPSSLIGQGGAGDNGPNTLDYFDIHRDYGNVIFTRRNRFVNTFNYVLPVGRGQMFMSGASRPVDLLVGGWNLTSITILQSGAFLTPTFTPSGDDPSGTNPGQRSAGSYQRPDCNSGVNPNTHNTPGYYFNPAAFSAPGSDIGRFGNCPVGFLLGPPTKNFSASLGKNFAFTERIGLRYEADFANLLNIRNPADPNTKINSGSFGLISAVQSAEQAGPRTIQMSLRLSF